MRKKSSHLIYLLTSSVLLVAVQLADHWRLPQAGAEIPHPPGQSQQLVGLPEDKGCVAWQTQETLFGLWKNRPTGRNCQISSVLQQTSPGLFRFQMLVPIAGFKSGSQARDRAVRSILKYDIQPNLFFVTEARPPKDWQKFLQEGETAIDGFLSIAGSSYPIHTTIHIKERQGHFIIYGLVRTRFEQLGLHPPIIFGGAFTRVAPELDLIFQIPTQETDNFQIVAGP